MKANEIIERHKTHDILDSSKMQCYMDCPRKFLYKYVLGWTIDKPNIHLVFGEAWHRMMEHMLLTKLDKGYDEKEIVKAVKKFMAYYRDHFGSEYDDTFAPKNPEGAMLAIVDYVEAYKRDTFTVLHTEVHGYIPISDSRQLAVRLDSIVQSEAGVSSVEHKTSKYQTKIWGEQWQLSVQIGAYNHALYCNFDEEEVQGVTVSGTFFKKSGSTFERVQVKRSPRSMVAWFDMVNDWYDSIIKDMSLLLAGNDSDSTLVAFRMNPQSCNNFMRMCMYHDFCNAWSNPLQRCSKCPPGFIVERWNPADVSGGATEMVGGKIVKDKS